MHSEARPKLPLAIFMYHAVTPAPLPVADWCFLGASAFGRQMEAVKAAFDVLPLSEAVGRLRTGFERPTAVLTFDDGFQSVREVAFPILRRLRLPASVFLVTGLVGTADTVWFCRLNRALGRTRRPWVEAGADRVMLGDARARARAATTLKNRLKTLPPRRLSAALREWLLALDEDPEEPVEPGSPYRMLTREAVAELTDSGLVEFGGHTHSHAILTRLPPRHGAAEIRRSLRLTRELTGRPCRLFAYPNGEAGDYDRAAVSTLRSAGVRAAVTALPGPNLPATSRLELRRYGVGAGMTMPAFHGLLRDHLTARQGSSAPARGRGEVPAPRA